VSFSRALFAKFETLDSRAFAALAFFVPFAVRLLPELFMGGFVTGFDTIGYYVPVMINWGNGGVGLLKAVSYAPLFYSLLNALLTTGVPITIALKTLPPTLHGFLGSATYFYAKKGLHWASAKSVFVSCLATLYFVSLRISWDMLRSELSLIFLFAFLTFLRGNWKEKPWKCYALFLPTTIFVVLSHQLTSVIMFAIVSVTALQSLVNKEYTAARDLVLSALPSAAIFCLVAYAGFAVSPESSLATSASWLSLFGFPSYASTLADALGFLLYCYLPLSLFALFGVKALKNSELRVWLSWCLIGVLLGTIGWYGLIPLSYRWTLLMVFPLAFFAAEGFGRLRFHRLRIALSGPLVVLSLGFVLLPTSMGFPYFRLFPNYIPSSVLQNTVALSDCSDVVKALTWANGRLGSDGVLLAHDAFYGWSLLYLNRNRIVCYGYENPQTTAAEMFANGYHRLFLVWWVAGEGWHGTPSLSSCFVEIFRSGEIAVYEYKAA
jgi:hypothetical protein